MRVLALVLLLCASATLLGIVRAEETVDDEAEDAGDDEDADAPPPPVGSPLIGRRSWS